MYKRGSQFVNHRSNNKLIIHSNEVPGQNGENMFNLILIMLACNSEIDPGSIFVLYLGTLPRKLFKFLCRVKSFSWYSLVDIK